MYVYEMHARDSRVSLNAYLRDVHLLQACIFYRRSSYRHASLISVCLVGMHLLQACVIEPFRFEPLGYIPPIYGRNSLSNLPTPELIQVPARVLSRQAADQHTTVLG